MSFKKEVMKEAIIKYYLNQVFNQEIIAKTTYRK